MNHRSHQQHPSLLPSPLCSPLCQQLPHSLVGLGKPWGFLMPLLHWDLITGCYKSPSDSSPHQHRGRTVLPAPPGQPTNAQPITLLAPGSLKATTCCNFSLRRSWCAPWSHAPRHGVTSLPRVGNVKEAALLPPLFSCWLCQPWLGGDTRGCHGPYCLLRLPAMALLLSQPRHQTGASVLWREGDGALPRAGTGSCLER